MQESWIWEREEYIKEFDTKKRISPEDYRKGTKLEKS